MNKLDLSNTGDRIFSKMLQRQAEQIGDKTFLIADNCRITFSQAEQMSNALASGLHAMGARGGDRIALYLSNCPEMVLLALAINKLGAIWIPINTDYKGEWLLDTLISSQCNVLITDSRLQHRIVDVHDQLDSKYFVVVAKDEPCILAGAVDYMDLLRSVSPPVVKEDASYGDTCAILWTSGTTGKSKGVMQSYNTWVRAIVDGASKQFQSQEEDIIYCVLPLFNAAAWITCIFRALIEGLPCVIEEKFSVSSFWERVRHFGATQTFAVGAMGVFLMNTPVSEADAKTPLRKASIIPMPLHLWKSFEQRFTLNLLPTGMGMSECLMIVTQLEERADVPVYAIGFPPKDVIVGLFDENGVEVPDGEVGEICVKPLKPYVLFNGYFNNPKATEQSYRGEWFLTGDMGRKDPETEAYFYVDRKKDAVRFAGRNISTLEVESVIRAHPAVADVAAFGIQSKEVESEDELMIKLVLCDGEPPTYEALCAFINENAPHYFVPRYMEYVDCLPYTPTNKVQKYLLREVGVSEATWDLKKSDYRVVR